MIKKWEALQGAILAGRLKPGALIIYARLLDHCNSRTGLCFPSEETIGRATGFHVRMVRTHIRAIEDAGYVRTVRGSGPGRSNRYLLAAFTGTNLPEIPARPCAANRKDSSAKSLGNPRKNPAPGSDAARTAPGFVHVSRGEEKNLAKMHGQYEQALRDHLGGEDGGWSRLLDLPSEAQEEPLKLYQAGTIGLQEAVELTLKNAEKISRS
jgi:hypothetical protein